MVSLKWRASKERMAQECKENSIEFSGNWHCQTSNDDGDVTENHAKMENSLYCEHANALNKRWTKNRHASTISGLLTQQWGSFFFMSWGSMSNERPCQISGGVLCAFSSKNTHLHAIMYTLPVCNARLPMFTQTKELYAHRAHIAINRSQEGYWDVLLYLFFRIVNCMIQDLCLTETNKKKIRPAGFNRTHSC